MRLLQVALTDLGDFISASAVAVVIMLWCWRYVSRLAAAGFILAYASTVGVVYGLKMVSLEVNHPATELGLFQLSEGAPSGHMALVVFVYGLAALLFHRGEASQVSRAGFYTCLAVIASVGVTRVTLHTHSLADVLAGAVVGALLLAIPAAIVVAHTQRARPITKGLLPVMAIVALLVLWSGLRMPSTNFIV